MSFNAKYTFNSKNSFNTASDVFNNAVDISVNILLQVYLWKRVLNGNFIFAIFLN